MADEFDIVVAGGGIAGLTAALYAARAGRKTMVVPGAVLGGHLLSVEIVEGLPGNPDGMPGYDYCPIAQEQAMEAGAEFSAAEVDAIEFADGKWTVKTAEGDFAAGAVIVATGTEFAKLGVPGEDNLQGRGVSQCATCDGPMLGGKTALVVGGGDSAAQEALTLAKFADRVVMLVREDTLSAEATYGTRLEAEPKIEIQYGTAVEEILGDDSGVTGVRVSGGAGEIEAPSVFTFVGLVPNSSVVGDFAEKDGTGRIKTDQSMRAATPGLFAAGSVRAGNGGQAVSAAGDGATAALAAHRYLTDGLWSGQDSADAPALELASGG